MNVEDVEELEELEELTEEDLETVPREDADFSILAIPCTKVWQVSYTSSQIPFVILDNRLRLIWGNDAYVSRIGRGEANTGDYLTRIFSNSKNETLLQAMWQSISAKEAGYSWQGRLETSSSREHLTIIVNLLISPISNINVSAEKPVGYGVVFDDITEVLNSSNRKTFSSLLEASKLKDNDTGKHIERVNEYSKTLAASIFGDPQFPDVDREYIENIGFLAAMHDVGKIGTPDDILNKEGPLNEQEWKIMQEHTINGAYILNAYPNPMARDIARSHHEKWDGSGYPFSITKDLIPLAARIVAIADVYDALRMKRSYKSAMPHQEAAKIMLKNSGTHFDPRLIEYFKNLEDDFTAIYSRLGDD